VAEDKKKEADGKAEGGKKKGLPPIVMIALGAIVGGAGVVFAVPPKTIEKKVEEKPKEYVDVGCPDIILHEFNPATRAGKGSARLAFKFRYTVREDQKAEAVEALKAHWDDAKSNTLLMLKARSYEELNLETGMRLLEKDLISCLDDSLFPVVDGEKVAHVTKIVWDKIQTQ